MANFKKGFHGPLDRQGKKVSARPYSLDEKNKIIDQIIAWFTEGSKPVHEMFTLLTSDEYGLTDLIATKWIAKAQKKKEDAITNLAKNHYSTILLRLEEQYAIAKDGKTKLDILKTEIELLGIKKPVKKEIELSSKPVEQMSYKELETALMSDVKFLEVAKEIEDEEKNDALDKDVEEDIIEGEIEDDNSNNN